MVRCLPLALRSSHGPGTDGGARFTRLHAPHSSPAARAVLVLRVSLSVAMCARMRHRSSFFRDVCSVHVLCRAGCKRTGLNSLRCARERRSNARPLSRLGCTHSTHEASCSHGAIVLVMRPACAATRAGRAQRAGAVPPWAWRLAAGRLGLVAALPSCTSRTDQYGSTRLTEAAFDR